MSRFLEVKQHDPHGAQYSASAYPGPGAYIIPDGSLVLVSANHGTHIVSASSMPPLSFEPSGVSIRELMIAMMLMGSMNGAAYKFADALTGDETISEDVRRAKKFVDAILA